MVVLPRIRVISKFYSYWAGRSSSYLPYDALSMLSLELMFPPLICAFCSYFMDDGMLVLSIFYHYMYRNNLDDECSQR